MTANELVEKWRTGGETESVIANGFTKETDPYGIEALKFLGEARIAARKLANCLQVAMSALESMRCGDFREVNTYARLVEATLARIHTIVDGDVEVP